ncbi:hypothetical protein DI005_01055 [Prauserella sp. PE36]|uniref:YHS domain-containing protein n=1 Tax=Prauserella sp. PE36 TaxID=1504709 RepID=UPI000D9F5ADC|nr:YHS domain-containing protein [Prauserella sp. PE36]PXY25947.1 hypothetical protein BAY59_20550 [Prauserella coralliicola]RBM24154.1 hypothetical protein DI005_01055 [Prauserella sp. PE36]
MMFVEVFTPEGFLTSERRDRLAHDLVNEVVKADSAPPEVLEAERAISHVVFHEVGTWYTGGRRAEHGLLVRVSVPEGWREDMSPYLVEIYGRLLGDSAAMVHVVGVPEGGLGLGGEVLRANDIVRLITRPFRESGAQRAEPPAGSGLDPVCGMYVPFEHAAGTAERDGTRYAFCSKGCHEVFEEERTRLQ